MGGFLGADRGCLWSVAADAYSDARQVFVFMYVVYVLCHFYKSLFLNGLCRYFE